MNFAENMERCNCCHSQYERIKKSIPSWSSCNQLSLAIQSCNKTWIKSVLAFPDKDFHILKDKFLCQAVKTGDSDIVLEMLAAGADPNEKCWLCGKCSVHICAEHCNINCLEVLIGHGADVNQLDNNMRSVMHFAAQNGRKECIKWLVDHNTFADEADADGYTPLHVASCLGHIAACNSLLTPGGADVNCLSKDGWSPLHMAASYGHLEVVKLYLSFNAHVEEKTLDQETALHLACGKGFADIAQALLDHGAMIESHNSHGATPLHYAVFYGHLHIVYNLLKSGANVNFLQLSKDVSCPLNLAAMKGDQEMLLLLQRAGCVVHPQTATLMYNRRNISAEYREEISQFPSLRDMCVWKIRQALAPDLKDKAMVLPLPEILKCLVSHQHLQIR